jgi:hypothetical protein
LKKHSVDEAQKNREVLNSRIQEQADINMAKPFDSWETIVTALQIPHTSLVFFIAEFG